MSSAEEYATWIVSNAAMKDGSPEEQAKFTTVKAAYNKAKSSKTEVNPIAGTVRAALQGLTMGFSDEVGGGIAALAGSLQTGESFDDAYTKVHQQLQNKREQFSEDHPVIATGAEIGGAMLTGGVGGGRFLARKGLQNASRLKKFGNIAGIGAVEGGVYGAGTADQDQRLTGATTGAGIGTFVAPLGAAGINGLVKVGGGVTNYAKTKLASTPKDQALAVLRETAEATGYTADDAVNKMQALGSQGTIADLNDGFRMTARAGMNRQGTMRDEGKNLVFNRQRGQQNRLVTVIEATSGKAEAYKQTLYNVIEQRSKKASPIYQEAYAQGMKMTPELETFLQNPLIKSAYNRGKMYAKGEGREGDVLRTLHNTKEVLDDSIEAAMNKVVKADKGKSHGARLMQIKSELLGFIEQQNPKYIEAKDMFASESLYANAIKLGKDVLKKDPEDIEALVRNMSEGELELFRLGGVKAISKLLDKAGGSRDAVKRLLDSSDMRQRLSLIMDDPTDFLRAAGIEEKFSQTKNALTGNSTTALQQEAGKILDKSIDSGMAKAVASANPQSIIAAVVDTVSRGQASPEVIDELGKMMFKQGMSPTEIRQIFQSSPIKRIFGAEYDRIVAPYVQSVTTPAAMAMQE